MTYQTREISTSREHARLQRIFKLIHERKAQTLMSATGSLMLLPMLAEAQAVDAAASNAASNIASTAVQANGAVQVTLTNGQTLLVSASNVTIGANGAVILSEAALAEIAALSATTATTGGVAVAGLAGAGGAAAAGLGVVGLGAALGGGGGGGGDSSGTVSRTIQAIDAPLQNALVFYDTDRDGSPDQTEYLGLTDENGALEITYTPVENASFIMIPSPVADDVASGYGWTNSFTSQFDDVVTRDIVTDNVFDQILSSPDTGGTEDAVLSPVSTLIDNGVPEETVRDLLDLPADLDLATFNFNEALASDDPATREAAESLSTAAVMLNSVVESAVSAASAETNLTPEQVVEVATRAIEDTVAVFNALPEDTPIEEVAYVATAVSTASALNPDIDTEAVVQDIETAVDAGGDASNAVDTEITDLVNDGTLSNEESATVGATAQVLEQTTQAVEQVFDNLVVNVAAGQEVSDAVTEALEQTALDDTTDQAQTNIQNAINEELLGIDLQPDSNTATEGQTTLLEGNVLANDAFSDGSDLPGETVLLEVNGVSVPAPEFDTTVTKDFTLSTSSQYRYSWYQDDSGAWRWKRTGATTESAQDLLDTIDFNGQFQAAYDATEISDYFYEYYLERYTYYNERYYGNRYTETQIENFARNSAGYAERYYARFDYEPTDGSMVYQTVTVSAGDTLSFDYNFAGYDYLPFNDTSFFAVQKLDGAGNADGQGEIISGLPSGANPNGMPDLSDVKGDELFNGVCVWQSIDGSYSYTFTEAGTFNIAIGAVDVGRNGAKAQLEVDNFQMIQGGVAVPGFEANFQSAGNVSASVFAQTSETALFIQGYYGTLIISGEGDYVYQVGGINAEPIPEGDVVTDNFTYSIELPDGRIATQTLGIEVTGTDGDELVLPSITIYSGDVNIADGGILEVTGATGNADGQPVNIVITDRTGATVTEAGLATNADGTFAVQIDVSSLADGPLDIVGTVTDGINLGQSEIEVELDQTINASPVSITITETRADEVIFSLSGLAGDETARVVFSDGTNEAFQGIVANGAGYSIDISDLNGAVVATSRILITDDAGNTAEVNGPSIFSPTVTLTVPQVNIANQDALTISGTTDADPSLANLNLVVADSDPTSPDVTIPGVTINANGTFSVSGIDLSSLEDGDLTVTAQVGFGGETYTQDFAAAMDTEIALPSTQVLEGPNAAVIDINNPTVQVEVTGFEPGATGSVTISNGVDTPIVIPVTADGIYDMPLGLLDPDLRFSLELEITDAAGNNLSTTIPDQGVPRVLNQTQNTFYENLEQAVADADPDDVLELAQGTFDEDITIDIPLTLLGFQSGQSAGDLGSGRTATLGDVSLDEADWAGDETVLNGTITIAAQDVSIDGMTFGSETQPLVWDESLLTPGGGELDGFSLTNSIIVGVNSSGALSFNAGADPAGGPYNGPAMASGWTISDNIIGGLLFDGDNTGVLNIAGLDGAQISDNVFWRPTASHIYANSMTNTTFADNYFLHGVHAGGVDFDGFGDHFEATGYGYGYGYGGSGSGDLFLGRNLWLELSGDNDQVTISGNDGAYNSGGVQLFAENAAYSFENIYITDNNFEQFVNADPEGVLGAGRAQSGFMGAVVASVSTGSTANGIFVTGNTIEAAYDQIFSTKDIGSLIAGQGFITDLTVSGNQITWVPTSSVAILAELDDLGASTSTFTGAVSAITLAGGLDGTATVTGNTIVEGLSSQVAGLFLLSNPDGDGVEMFGDFDAPLVDTGNDTAGITGAGSADIVIQGLYNDYDWSSLTIESDVILYVNQVDNPGGTPSFFFGEVLFGTGADETITPGGGYDFTLAFGRGGDDIIDLSAPTNLGRNFVLVDKDQTVNGTDTIIGFTAGDHDLIANADRLSIVDLVNADDLRGTGDIVDFVTSGDAVDANAGLLVFTNALAGSDFETDLTNAVETLTGLADGDTFFVVANHADTDTVVYEMNMSGGEAQFGASGPLAILQGVDVGTLHEDNFSTFVAVPEA
jgi:VCBS repeat-containing protein